MSDFDSDMMDTDIDDDLVDVMDQDDENDSMSDLSMNSDEDEDEGFGATDSQILTNDKVVKKPYDVDYRCKGPNQLKLDMEAEVEKIRGVFGMDAQTATLLLRSFGWNREKLVDKYMDEPDECLIAAGVDVGLSSEPIQSTSTEPPSSPARKSRRTNTSSSLGSSSSKRSKPNPEEFSCPICCLDFSYEDIESDTLALPACNHRACKSCWGSYLEGKIRDEGESGRIECMEGGCGKVVPVKIVEMIVSDETRFKYHELLNRTYVDDNPTLRWCPGPNCQFAVECRQAPPRVLNTIIPSVTCECGQRFCFGCGHPADHRPVLCKIVRLWQKKCKDDSETANWISANTKECDRCHSTIEKNGGCNHMTCKKCKHEFCWVCMGPWSEHGTAWYNCNRYDEKAGVEARDGQSKSRASLERYLHYYNRWANHEHSAKLDRDLYEKTEKKMEEMQKESNLTWIEVQFAKKAVDTLVIARMTLKWTYCMAFYLKRNNATEIFESNQSDLEMVVESLSELLEKPIDKDQIAELRTEVTNKTAYVKKRENILLDDALQGYLEGRWEFSVDI